MGGKADLNTFIAGNSIELEPSKIYGNDRKYRDLSARQSKTAGELCLTYSVIEKAENKAKHRPGSIGARKAKQKAKKLRKKQRELEQLLAANEYHARKPQHTSTAKETIMNGARLKPLCYWMNSITPLYSID